MQRLKTSDVIASSPLPWDVFDNDGRLLLRRGFIIDNAKHIQRLINEGLYANAASAPTDAPPPTSRTAEVFSKCQFLEEMLDYAFKYEANQKFISQLNHAYHSVAMLSQRYFDIALAYWVLHGETNYAVKHLLRCALVVAHLLEDEEPDVQKSVISAALTMNISIIEAQNQFFMQTAPLDKYDRLKIRVHPDGSHRRLKGYGITDQLWLDTVLQHHERPNGLGYPYQIKPGKYALLLGLVDSYCAGLVRRKDKRVLNPKQMAKELLMADGEASAQSMASMLIKRIGVFPPGSCVSLNNGERGIVVKRPDRGATMPTVAALISPAGYAYVEPIIRQTAAADTQIVSVFAPGELTVRPNLEKLWD